MQATIPVNKFPDFVVAKVTKLKRLFPAKGRTRKRAWPQTPNTEPSIFAMSTAGPTRPYRIGLGWSIQYTWVP